MKSFAFALLAAAAVASDVNGTTTGPTSTTISSSTVTFTPTVSTAQLTVIVAQGYVMAADLASATETQAATCFQHATALWYCTNVVRTITDASQGHTDARTVYSSTTAPAVADITATSKFNGTSVGFSVTTKYTSVAVQASAAATVGNSGAISGSTSGTDAANWTFQTAGNTINADKRTCATKMQYQKTESSATVATTALASIKTGYATTFVGVQSTIGSTTVSGTAVSNLTGAATFAAAAAAIAAVMAF